MEVQRHCIDWRHEDWSGPMPGTRLIWIRPIKRNRLCRFLMHTSAWLRGTTND